MSGALPEPEGPLLGIDFGDYRYGFAMSTRLLFPVWALEDRTFEKGVDAAVNFPKAAAHVHQLLMDHDVAAIVVGLPLNYDGTTGPAAEKVRAFLGYLRSVIERPFWEGDERLTTDDARRRRSVNENSEAAASMLRQFVEDPACRLAFHPAEKQRT